MYQPKCPECGKEIAASGTQCPACRKPLAEEARLPGDPPGQAPASRLTPQQLSILQICGLGAVLMFAGGTTYFWGEVILLGGIGGFLATRLGAR
jgi:hypothetical protein